MAMVSATNPIALVRLFIPAPPNMNEISYTYIMPHKSGCQYEYEINFILTTGQICIKMNKRGGAGMEKKEIRNPQQRRSIEKKNRIIDAARRLFIKNGYFGTNTAEIAQEAGISTGSVYAYFEDKKDILLAVLHKFGREITEDICNEINRHSEKDDLFNTAKQSVKVLVKSHEGQSRLYHDEIESLRYRDEDIKRYFAGVQKTLMAAVAEAVAAQGYIFPHDREQTFLLFRMVDGIEDELTFSSNPDIDHAVLLDECAKLIVTMVARKDDKKSEVLP
jgi:Transcriptional regulator